jgi:hypothetical protein
MKASSFSDSTLALASKTAPQSQNDPLISYNTLGLPELNERRDHKPQPIILTPAIVEVVKASTARYEANIGHRIRRPLSLKRLKAWKAMHLADEFLPIGEPLKFSDPEETGEIIQLDGWHRDEIVLDTGKPLHCYAQAYIPLKWLPYMDAGRSRSGADNLAMTGYHNPGRLAAMAALIYLFERRENNPFTVVTSAQIVSIIEKYKDLATWATDRLKQLDRPFRIASIGAACYWIEKTADPRRNNFINKILYGDNLQEGDPERAVRKRILEGAYRERSKRGRYHVLMMIFNGWRYLLKNQRISHIKNGGTIYWPGGAPYIF